MTRPETTLDVVTSKYSECEGHLSWTRWLPPYYHVTAPWQLLQPVPHNKLAAEVILLLGAGCLTI